MWIMFYGKGIRCIPPPPIFSFGRSQNIMGVSPRCDMGGDTFRGVTFKVRPGGLIPYYIAPAIM
jgi:hypothetical protein